MLSDNPLPAPGRFHGVFRDIHELGLLAGFELDFRSLSADAPKVPATVVRGPGCIAVDMHLQGSFHQRGLAPAGSITVGIPRHGMQDWFGRYYSTDSILPFNLPSGIDAVSNSGFKASVLSLPAERLEEIANENGRELPRRLTSPASGEAINIGPANRSLRRMLQQVIDTPGSAIDEDTELALSLLLLEAAEGVEDRAIKTAAAKRGKALKDALEVIAARRDDPPSVHELCTLIGVPVRTLSRAFKERFGIGPKAYINQLRLSRVRSSIVIGEPGTPIASLANQQGFWHMGQFAKDYRTLFGELPSETATEKQVTVAGGLPSQMAPSD